MRGQPVAAFCGIGNPAGFRHTLETCGCRVVGFREFPDHHRYTPADVDRLADWADGLGVSAVLCTGKDLVKLPVDRLGDRPLWAVGSRWSFSPARSARIAVADVSLPNVQASCDSRSYSRGADRLRS